MLVDMTDVSSALGAHLAPGATLGAYRIVRLLGQGGMGAVHEAVHVRVNKRVAIKTLHAHVAASTEGVARFMREAEAAARIRHPHTVDVTDVGVENSVAYLVMEFLEGEDLGKRLERSGTFRVDELVDLMLPVCSALSATHEEGIVHRDLKPENIFVARTRADTEVVKLLDFGISHLSNPADAMRLTSTNSIMGTPYYISPELAGGAKNVGPPSDQYAFGVILYECITGTVPSKGDSLLQVLLRITTEPVVPPSALRGDLPPQFERVLMRCLEKGVAERFANMHEVGRALFPFASQRGQLQWSVTYGGGETPQVSAPTAARVSLPAPTPVRATQAELPIPVTEAPPTLPASNMGWIALASVFIAIGVAAVAWRLSGDEAPATTVPARAETFLAAVTASPSEAELTLDGTLIGTGTMSAPLALDGRTHTLVVSAPNHESQTFTFRDAPPPRAVTLAHIAPTLPEPIAVEPTVSTRTQRPDGPRRATRETPVAPVAVAPVAPPVESVPPVAVARPERVQTPEPERVETPAATAPEGPRRGPNGTFVLR